MAELTPKNMTNKLLASSFERNSPSATALTDPIVDTPMVVTLDELRPYDHDPRVKRNPAYEEIKASIRERGLDAAPAIPTVLYAGFAHTSDVGEDIVAEPIWQDPLVVAVSTHHPLLEHTAIPLHALAHYPLILFQYDAPLSSG